MPKHTYEQIAERRAAVEKVAVSGLWNQRTLQQLSKRFNVTVTQLYMDRQWCIKQARKALHPKDIDDARGSLLMQSQEALRIALKNAERSAGYLSVAHKCMDFQARLLGAYEPDKVDLSVREPSDTDIRDWLASKGTEVIRDGEE